MPQVARLRWLGPEKVETLTGVTHVLITKYILKLAGICGICNINNVRNINITHEWHEAIKLKYKKELSRHAIFVLRVPSTIQNTWMASISVTWLNAQHTVLWRKHICTLRLVWAVIGHHIQGQTSIKLVSWQVQCVDKPEDHISLSPLSP
jgi:hypothetical protein